MRWVAVLAAAAVAARLSGAEAAAEKAAAAGEAFLQGAQMVGQALGTGSAPVPASPTAAPALDEEGLVYVFTLSSLSVRASNPLSYTPLELGYRWANGVQVRSGLDLFYYEADDLPLPRENPQKKGEMIQDPARPYRFEMMDWRTTLCYLVPLTARFRPLAGLSLDMVRGERSLVGKVNPPKEDAYGFIGASLVLGLEWRFSRSAALGLSGRGTHSFKDAIGILSSVNLSWLYLF